MLLHGHVPRDSFDYKHHQKLYSNVDSKAGGKRIRVEFPVFLSNDTTQDFNVPARFLLKQNYSLILRGCEPRSVETFEFRTKIKMQNSVPNSKHTSM